MSKRVWDMERGDSDVVRFVLRRSEWEKLITALAGASAWAPGHCRDDVWAAMDILRSAEEDIDASDMVRRLAKIAEMTRGDSRLEVVHIWAANIDQKREVSSLEDNE